MVSTMRQRDADAAAAVPVRVVIAEGDEVTLLGLRRLLDRPGFEVVGVLRSLDEHVDVVGLRPDVVLLDPLLQGGDAFALCSEVRADSEIPRCLVVAHMLSRSDRAAAQAAGLAGYITDDVSAQCLLAAIADVAAQRVAQQRCCNLFCDCDDSGTPPDPAMSPQERRTAELIAEGLTDAEIARMMGLSPKTVRNYVSHVLAKLDVPRRTGVAAALARRETVSEAGS